MLNWSEEVTMVRVVSKSVPSNEGKSLELDPTPVSLGHFCRRSRSFCSQVSPGRNGHRSSQTNDATTFYIITLRQVNTPCGEAKRIASSRSPIYVDHIAFLKLPMQSYAANAAKEEDGEGEGRSYPAAKARSSSKGPSVCIAHCFVHRPASHIFSVYSFYLARFYVLFAWFMHLNPPRSSYPPLAGFTHNLLPLSVTSRRLFAPTH